LEAIQEAAQALADICSVAVVETPKGLGITVFALMDEVCFLCSDVRAQYFDI